jgi:hypothetical protein
MAVDEIPAGENFAGAFFASSLPIWSCFSVSSGKSWPSGKMMSFDLNPRRRFTPNRLETIELLLSVR